MRAGSNFAVQRRTRPARSFWLIAAAAAAVFSVPMAASAGLILDSVRYDGHVRDGSNNMGVEAHFTNDDFPPPSTLIDLPATGNPPAPLSPSNNLRMTFSQTIESVNSMLFDAAIVQITNPTGIDIFANDLDSTLQFPVEFETFVYLDDLEMGDKLVITSIGVENNNTPPFGTPGTSLISSNRGSQTDPIRIQLGLTASQVALRNGYVKFHIRYDTMPVPEPASGALLGIAIVGLAGVAGRRRA